MKILENLVWDKHAEELIRSDDLGDIELDYGTLPKFNGIALYMIVFLIHSMVSLFKFSLANFEIKDIQTSQMFPLLW